MKRQDDRFENDIRQIIIIPGFSKFAEGSVLISQGDTKVLCTASVEEKVPPHKLQSGEGWVTAEYSMLPRSTNTRNTRDIDKLKLASRSAEIQRLIGRSLRAAVDLSALGPRTITVDCDVLQADGGTRTASITGGYVAMVLALKKLMQNGVIERLPITRQIAAISAGIVDGRPNVDLCYSEDSRAQVDMNVVMDHNGSFIEIQGTAEGKPYSKKDLDTLISLCGDAIKKIHIKQNEITGETAFYEACSSDKK